LHRPSFLLPFTDFSLGRVKISANQSQGLPGKTIFAGIIMVFDLLQHFVGALIQLEFKQIDVLACTGLGINDLLLLSGVTCRSLYHIVATGT
jgi:hypothetical protein